MDLSILNTIIALVIVLLVLSLLVQSVQTLVKKLLKLKSRQIQNSLVDLYEQAIERGTPPDTLWSRLIHALPLSLRSLFGGPQQASRAEQFSGKVLEEFKKIGRVTIFGSPVLDSLSKGDLFKVMGKLELDEFFPTYAAKFKDLCDQILALRTAIEELTKNPSLRGAANTRVTEIRAILAPVFNDIQMITEEQTQPKTLFADLMRLRKLDVRQLLELFEQAQQTITEERETANKAGQTDQVQAFDTVSEALTKATDLIGGLTEKFDDAVLPLRNKLEQVEIWFDTVTQSFDERYTRNMRTVSICISIVVVILLNANFFRVYKSISTNEVQRNLIVENAPAVLERAKQAESPETPTASPVPSPTPIQTREDLDRTLQEIDVLSSTYQGFGFSPVSGQQVWSFLLSTGFWTVVLRDEQGNSGLLGIAIVPNERGAPVWRAQTLGDWWHRRQDNVVTLVGWAIMVMLLSVGAPFWQDTLESLFGIKNLLRQKSATQNIETQSGAGQPKE